MNVLWRTLLVMWNARRRLRAGKSLAPDAVGTISLRVLPTDLDVLMHMNNGRYFSLLDLGRWDLLVRAGLWDAMKERGWYGVVGAETITFRKSLQLWQRFTVETRIVGHDDKSIFMEQRAVVRGEIYARAVIRTRILRRSGGTVPHDELFAAVGTPDTTRPLESWVAQWSEGTALPPVRGEAPSVWE